VITYTIKAGNIPAQFSTDSCSVAHFLFVLFTLKIRINENWPIIGLVYFRLSFLGWLDEKIESKSPECEAEAPTTTPTHLYFHQFWYFFTQWRSSWGCKGCSRILEQNLLWQN